MDHTLLHDLKDRVEDLSSSTRRKATRVYEHGSLKPDCSRAEEDVKEAKEGVLRM